MVLLIREDEVKELVSFDEIIDAVEDGFRIPPEDYTLAGRVQYEQEDPLGELFILSGRIESPDVLGVKSYTLFVDNDELGLPRGEGNIVLYDPETGQLDVLMDGTYLTDARTGAIGAVGARWLAPPDTTKLAVFGSSTQAKHQVLALDTELDLDRIELYSRSDMKYEAVAELEDKVSAELVAAETPADACEGADVIDVATSSTQPVFPGEALEPGALVIGVGSNRPTMREIPGEAMERAERVFVDDYERCLKVGDLADAMSEGRLTESRVSSLGDLCRGDVEGRTGPHQGFVVKSMGIVTLDLYLASVVQECAEQRDIGIDWDMLPGRAD